MEEEYDVFDEKYVRWLLLNHPDKVPGDWLQKVPTSSKQQVATQKGYQHVATLTYVYNKYCIVTGLQDNNHMEDSEQFDEELYAKRLEEEYDVFDEKYIRWLLLNHPDKVPGDWLQKVPTSSKQQVATRKGYQHVATLTYVYKYCIVTGLQDNNHMEDSEQFDEELYTKRLEEEYDVFDEKYVRWLLLNHPDKVHKDWLEKMPTSSKQSSTQVILNYSSVYEAVNRKRKNPRPVVVGLTQLDEENNYISKYLIQEITVPKEKNKQVRVSGARVLTSEECMKIVQEREDAKKEKALQLQKRKEERNEKKRKQETSKQEISKQKKGAPVQKGKAKKG